MLSRFFLTGECGYQLAELCLDYSFDYGLVLLSCVVAMFGAYAAFQLVARVNAALSRRANVVWLVISAVSMGSAIWSMHFIGMLAVSMQADVHYDTTLTGLSVVFAIIGSGLACYTLNGDARTIARLAAGAVFLGGGVGAMHYTGMAAMRMDATIRYDPLLFAASVLLAVALSFVALRLLSYSLEARKISSHVSKLAGGCVMGLSIAAMHYTAMSATRFIPVPTSHTEGFELDASLAAAVVAVVAFAITGLALIVAVFDLRGEIRNRKASQSDGFLSAVMNNIADGIIAIDQNAVVRMFNPAAERMFGYEAYEVLGQSVSILLEPDDREAHDDYVRNSNLYSPRVLGQRRVLSARRKDGTSLNVEISISVMQSHEVPMFIGVCHDITERLRVEEQLRETEKLGALGLLAGGVAHDFNNILMVIEGYTKRSLAKPEDPERVRSCLAEVVTAGNKAKGLTEQLLAFGRRQKLESKVIRAGSVFYELSTLLKPLLGETIDLSFDLADEDACIEADPSLLAQALINLAINARDAMAKGGRLKVAMDVSELEQSLRSQHPDAAPGSYVRFSVEDEGEGIDAETKARIFEPFFTTKEQGKGTGLGLPMVYGFVQQSSGIIEVNSEPGVGTTFFIYLPVVERKPTIRLVDEFRDLAARGETILLAEDDEALRRLAQTTLEELGYKVLAASDGFAALELESEHEGTVHLLLSDVVMPVMGGFELSRAVMEMRPSTKILLMSGYPSRGQYQKSDKPEGVPLLQKPLAPEELARAVRDILDQQEEAA